MKDLKLFSLSFLFLFSFNSFSQTVTIPDAGFVSYLQYAYPSCMTGNLMDTTCADIVNETNLSIPSSYNISNCYGVQFFDNLDTLDLHYHPLTALPLLPMDLQILNIAYCDVATIVNFPSTLTEIQMTSNNVTSIPALPAGLLHYYRGVMPNLPVESSLPPNLETYNIQQSNVVNLPPLPASLKSLSIGSNYGINMPVFPAGLETLGIDHLNLTSLPAIPNSLTYLYATHNNFTDLSSFPPILDKLYLNYCSSLTSIQNLPNTLQQFYANDCDLSNIDYLPNSIFVLHLHNNNLNSLPNLPNSATTIKLENNNLTALPTLPSIIYTLELSNNSIYCLPYLPTTISTISLDNNNFTCVPNILSAMSPTFQAYPLCVANDPNDNPFGCMASQGVEGYVYMDQNSNCDHEAIDVQLVNVPVIVSDNQGNAISSASTFTNGRYYFDLSTGQYEVEVDTIGKPYTVDCVYPGADSTVTLTGGAPLAGDVSFGMKCKPGFDVGTKSVHAAGLVFPGQPHTLVVKAGDMTNFYNMDCSNGVSGEVVVTVTGPVTFQGVSSGSLTPVISSNTYTYAVADFGAVNPNIDFRLDFTTDTTAVAGDFVCVDVLVTPSSGDIDAVNNDFSTCIPVVNSYDPNNKLVYPAEITPDYDGFITYTINFQNTGSAPAFNIRLEDTLSSLLDWNTFEMLDYSHDMHYILSNDKLVVYYPNIMLVDSTTSVEESKGHFTYRIKPNGTAVDTDLIENTAYIFFDFNPAIVTNTALTEVKVDVTSLDNLDGSSLIVYPNPSESFFHLTFDQDISDLKVFNQQGKLIAVDYDSASGELDLGDCQSGMYFLHLTSDDATYVKKLFKK